MRTNPMLRLIQKENQRLRLLIDLYALAIQAAHFLIENELAIFKLGHYLNSCLQT